MTELYFEKAKQISDRLYGIFLEDINCACDGGLNADLIKNPYFYALSRSVKKNKDYYLYKMFHIKKRKKMLGYIERNNPLFGWNYTSKNVEYRTHPVFLVDGKEYLRNIGYDGIEIKEGNNYELKISFAKESSFEGAITVGLYRGEILSSTSAVVYAEGERDITVMLTANVSAKTELCFSFSGKGKVSFSSVRLYDKDSFDFDGKNPYGGRMRRDLVEALKDLHPSFMRFPGGCIVEGYSLQNAYNWKDTVGKLGERVPKYNLWGEAYPDTISMQNYEIGFYEYFLLCEYLGASPMPILNAGIACQARSAEICPMSNIERYADDILDLIAYANEERGYWATLRKESGHEKPFNLKTIGIGNENWGEEYYARFAYIYRRVKQKYPDMEIVFSNGFGCYGNGDISYNNSRKWFDGKFENLLSDDHFYRTPSWTMKHENMYDDYDRNRYPIYLGEYASNGFENGVKRCNTYLSAFSEAVFLTGLERNADIVKMASYAPLFSRIGQEQWKHNLINFDGKSVLRTANYYVQLLFANNIGTTYIPTEKVNNVYLSVTTDEQYYYVKAVNIAFTRHKLHLPIKGKGEHVRLQSPDDDAVNTLFEEKIVPLYERMTFDEEFFLPPRSINVFKIRKISE